MTADAYASAPFPVRREGAALFFPRATDGSFPGVPSPDGHAITLELNVNQVRHLIAERATGRADHLDYTNESVLALTAKEVQQALPGGQFLGWRKDVPGEVRVSPLSKHRTSTFVFAVAPSAEEPARALIVGGPASSELGRADLTPKPVSAAALAKAEELVASAQVQDGFLTFTKLAAVPASIARFTDARNVSFHGCAICSLPPEFGMLTAIEKLDLSATKLVAFPHAVLSLVRLKHLSLASTAVAEVPDEIARLTLLESLDLAFTRVDRLPESMAKLTSLKTIRLPLSFPTGARDRLSSLLPNLRFL